MVLNLQSELDATQQEFENTVEELENIEKQLTVTRGELEASNLRCDGLNKDKDNLIAKVCILNVIKIQIVQLHNYNIVPLNNFTTA